MSNRLFYYYYTLLIRRFWWSRWHAAWRNEWPVQCFLSASKDGGRNLSSEAPHAGRRGRLLSDRRSFIATDFTSQLQAALCKDALPQNTHAHYKNQTQSFWKDKTKQKNNNKSVEAGLLGLSCERKQKEKEESDGRNHVWEAQIGWDPMQVTTKTHTQKKCIKVISCINIWALVSASLQSKTTSTSDTEPGNRKGFQSVWRWHLVALMAFHNTISVFTLCTCWTLIYIQQ